MGDLGQHFPDRDPAWVGADSLRILAASAAMVREAGWEIGNVDVNVGASGETATASFDKEWVFEGARRSTGKVRQQLQFRRISGQWLITSESDVRVYYTN